MTVTKEYSKGPAGSMISTLSFEIRERACNILLARLLFSEAFDRVDHATIRALRMSPISFRPEKDRSLNTGIWERERNFGYKQYYLWAMAEFGTCGDNSCPQEMKLQH